MDLQIANWIYATFGHSKAIATIAKIVTYVGNKWVIIAVVALLLLFKKTRKLGFYSLCAIGVVYIFNDYILKNIIKRDRPFIQNPELVNMINLAKYEIPDGYSMASGHSAIAMCLAVSVFLFHKKIGIGAIFVAVLVGLSRMVLCVHFLTDILAGFALGIVFAVSVYFVLNHILKIYYKKRGINNENNSSSNKQSA